MDPYGDYAIYFLDIFGTFEATLLAYLLGVLTILTLGMQMGYLFERIVIPRNERMALPKLEAEEKEIEGFALAETHTVEENRKTEQ